MEKAKIRLSAAIALIISVLTGLIVTFFCLPKSAVFAEETTAGDSKYTTVTEDLENVNGGFDTSKYPQKDGDYSLQFLTVAVNKSNELLVYVYQPAANINHLATSINIDNGSQGTKNYELSLIDSNSVFFKYKVDDFKIVYSAQEQTIEVVSIFREFMKEVDKNPSEESGNTILEVAYPIAQSITIKNGVVTKSKEVEVITITSKYVGFIRYNKDWNWDLGLTYADYTDSHFVAFSTDHRIDKLMYARVSYNICDLTADYWFSNYPNSDRVTITRGSTTKKIVDLRYTQVVESPNGSDTKYKFNRIQTSNEFLTTENVKDTSTLFGIFTVENARLSASEVERFKSKQFVLRFCETEVSEEQSYANETGHSQVIKSKEVSGVTILTLEYMVDGIVFRRNCVDNKQSGSQVEPGDSTLVPPDLPFLPDLPTKSDWEELLKKLLIITAVIAVVYVTYKIIQANGGVIAVASKTHNKLKSVKQNISQNSMKSNAEKRIDNGNVQIVINTTERSKKNGNKKK